MANGYIEVKVMHVPGETKMIAINGGEERTVKAALSADGRPIGTGKRVTLNGAALRSPYSESVRNDDIIMVAKEFKGN